MQALTPAEELTRAALAQRAGFEVEQPAAYQKLIPAVVWLAVLAGVAGGALALAGRGSEDLFRLQQSRSLAGNHAQTLAAGRVEAVVAQAPEPVSAARRTPPAAVRCRPHAGGTLGDPWSCTIRYRSNTNAHYSVVVQPNGKYRGVGTGIIDGCCVKVPTLE